MHNLMKTALSSALLAAALAVALETGAAEPRTVIFDAAFGAARIQEDADGLAAVRLHETGPLPAPGAPALPYRTVRLALPPDADLASVRVSVAPIAIDAADGPFDVAPAPPARRIDDGRASWGAALGRIVDGRDTAIYGVDALFPASWGAVVGEAEEIRGFKSVAVALHPVRYRPLSGELVAAEKLRVTVSYAPSRGETAPARGCRLDDPLAARLLDNFADAKPWYGGACALYPAPGDDGIAVITTDEIEDESMLLEEWTALRESQGYAVTVATDDDFDVPTGDPTEDARADRIRKWLKDNWEALGLGWVLLIGNPDPSESAVYSIPMKPCAAYEEEAGPTDFYYANLTDDFDGNGNGVYCEQEDNIDFVPDLYVGRLPCYSDGPAAVDEMLARILAYEEESASGDLEWRRRMLLPNAIYFYKNQDGDATMPRWDGATVGEWFIRDELEPRGMVWTTLYERAGFQPSQFDSHFPLDSGHVVDQWVRGYGFVFWAGHGSEVGVYRTIWLDDVNGNGYLDYTEEEYSSPEFMTQSYTFMLEDAPPPFVVHGSCSNATPETADNLAYNLLRRGAIATLAATRSALTWHFPVADPEMWLKPDEIDGDVVDMTTEYAHSVLAGAEAGRAHGDMIAVTTNFYGEAGMYQKSIQNLYGDPLVRLVMCRTGAECDDGDWCDGLEWCDDGACQAGTPIVCAPTDECAEMVCDETADVCAPGPSCIVDAGPDAAPSEPDAAPSAEVTGYGATSGCSAAPRAAATRPLLSTIF
jgi:hypothetical protein